jgi:hypothetical protein
MLRHGILRPLWLCDVALAVESRPADFDWTWFEAGRRRRTESVQAAVALAHRLLGARLDDVPAAVRERELPHWFEPAVLRQWSTFVPPHGSRAPIAITRQRPSVLLQSLLLRWPNPVEATVAVGAPFNWMPRLPFQVGDCLLRAARAMKRG